MLIFVHNTLQVFLMSTLPDVSPATNESPDAEFWAECRRRALEWNIPAWQLAEEGFQHPALDAHTRRG